MIAAIRQVTIATTARKISSSGIIVGCLRSRCDLEIAVIAVTRYCVSISGWVDNCNCPAQMAKYSFLCFMLACHASHFLSS